MVSVTYQGRLSIGSNWRQVIIAGVTTMTPMKSPSHQVRQDSPRPPSWIPAIASVATPQVEASKQHTAAIAANAIVVGAASNSLATPTHLRSNSAASMAWSVEPMAMLAATRMLETPASPCAMYDAQMLTRNEPIQMPGHTREPQASSAASARPEEGQTAVA